jgi:flavin-binding protein dodecin
MQGHSYQYFELVGTSKTSVEDAVQNVLTKAADELPNMRWFQLIETRGAIQDNKVIEWQVTVKVGCRLKA